MCFPGQPVYFYVFFHPLRCRFPSTFFSLCLCVCRAAWWSPLWELLISSQWLAQHFSVKCGTAGQVHRASAFFQTDLWLSSRELWSLCSSFLLDHNLLSNSLSSSSVILGFSIEIEIGYNNPQIVTGDRGEYFQGQHSAHQIHQLSSLVWVGNAHLGQTIGCVIESNVGQIDK